MSKEQAPLTEHRLFNRTAAIDHLAADFARRHPDAVARNEQRAREQAEANRESHAFGTPTPEEREAHLKAIEDARAAEREARKDPLY